MQKILVILLLSLFLGTVTSCKTDLDEVLNDGTYYKDTLKERPIIECAFQKSKKINAFYFIGTDSLLMKINAINNSSYGNIQRELNSVTNLYYVCSNCLIDNGIEKQSEILSDTVATILYALMLVNVNNIYDANYFNLASTRAQPNWYGCLRDNALADYGVIASIIDFGQKYIRANPNVFSKGGRYYKIIIKQIIDRYGKRIIKLLAKKGIPYASAVFILTDYSLCLYDSYLKNKELEQEWDKRYYWKTNKNQYR